MRLVFRWIRKFLSRSERIQAWYYERDMAGLHREYTREMADAQRLGDTEARDEIASRYSSESSFTQEELEYLRTERLLRRARQLRVPLPSPRPRPPRLSDDAPEEGGDENWWLGHTLYQWNLTEAGEARLRQAIRGEEKGRREIAAFWLSIITAPLAVLTALVGISTVRIAIQQKELSRLDHLPRIGCSVSTGLDQDSLIVANIGAPVRKMIVDRIVFFDAQPMSPPRDPHLERYLLADYYGDQLNGDYEGNQRMAFGLDGPRSNVGFARALTSAVVDSLGRRDLGWGGIEVGRAVRVVYWDWLGTKSTDYYWASGPAGDAPLSVERISARRWKQIAAAADSVRRVQRMLFCGAKTRESEITRVAQACIDAVSR